MSRDSEMLDQVLKVFEVEPDYDLNIMEQGQDLYEVTTKTLMEMKDVLEDVHPDVVLVQGDTTTSASAAIAAFYQQIPVGHVEAGLRTYNIYSPWPEEINRQLISRIATWHFAPSLLPEKNLKTEHVHGKIILTGNTGIDALHLVMRKLKNSKALVDEQISALKDSSYDVTRLDGTRRLVLVTGHRRENFGKGFSDILSAIKTLGEKFADVDFVYPMHLNPNVRKPIREVFEGLGSLALAEGWGKAGNVFFTEPLQYMDFVYLMGKATVVLTDSGGIQEEAPEMGKPVIVMREITERQEVIDAGTAKVVGTDHDRIVGEVSRLLEEQKYYDKMSKVVTPFGDGKASQRIVDFFRGKRCTC